MFQVDRAISKLISFGILIITVKRERESVKVPNSNFKFQMLYLPICFGSKNINFRNYYMLSLFDTKLHGIILLHHYRNSLTSSYYLWMTKKILFFDLKDFRSKKYFFYSPQKLVLKIVTKIIFSCGLRFCLKKPKVKEKILEVPTF